MSTERTKAHRIYCPWNNDTAIVVTLEGIFCHFSQAEDREVWLLDSNNGTSRVKDQHGTTPILSLQSPSLSLVIFTSVASILLQSLRPLLGWQAAVGYSTVCFFKLCKSSGSCDTCIKIYVHTHTNEKTPVHTHANFFNNTSTFPVCRRRQPLANFSAEDLCIFWGQTSPTLHREHHLQLKWYDWISA